MTIISAASVHTSDINACCEELRIFRYWSYKTKSGGGPWPPPCPPCSYPTAGWQINTAFSWAVSVTICVTTNLHTVPIGVCMHYGMCVSMGGGLAPSAPPLDPPLDACYNGTGCLPRLGRVEIREEGVEPTTFGTHLPHFSVPVCTSPPTSIGRKKTFEVEGKKLYNFM